jgi:hypothetical protein
MILEPEGFLRAGFLPDGIAFSGPPKSLNAIHF